MRSVEYLEIWKIGRTCDLCFQGREDLQLCESGKFRGLGHRVLVVDILGGGFDDAVR